MRSNDTATTHGVALPHLRAWRDYRLLTQVQLAQRARISPRALISIELGGNARVSTIQRLADALRVTPARLAHTAPREVISAA